MGIDFELCDTSYYKSGNSWSLQLPVYIMNLLNVQMNDYLYYTLDIRNDEITVFLEAEKTGIIGNKVEKVKIRCSGGRYGHVISVPAPIRRGMDLGVEKERMILYLDKKKINRIYIKREKDVYKSD